MKKIKITIINDNIPGMNLKNSWGWSVFIESDKWKVLFDADTEPSIIEFNTKSLNIDLGNLSFAVLSHYHADHYGGFKYVGYVARGLKVYVPEGDSRFLKDWGVEPVEGKAGMIAEDLWLSGSIGSFIKEQAIGVKIDSVGLVVVVGCSHPGVDTMTMKLKALTDEKIFLVIGGFHSPSKQILDNLAKIAQYISPAHCSGAKAREYVKTKYPEKYIDIATGSIINIP